MSWLRPLAGVSLIVPFYHMVSDEHVPHVSPLYRFRTITEFKADVEFFCRYYEPVSLQQIIDALNGGLRLPKYCVHLTFDDGFREMEEIVAPILERSGVPATFFLNTAFLDGGGLAHYNWISVVLDSLKQSRMQMGSCFDRLLALLPPPASREQTLQQRLLALGYSEKSRISELLEIAGVDQQEYVRRTRPCLTSGQVANLQRRGFTIGGHSHDHTLYAGLSLEDQIWQTKTSMDILEKNFGMKTKAFAFPHNDTGVTERFFSEVFEGKVLDVSFGTSGLIRHFHSRNIQRFTMEKSSEPALNIVLRQYARAIYRKAWAF